MTGSFYRAVLPFSALAASVVSGPAIAASETAEPAETGATILHLGESAEREMPRDRLRAQLRVEATGAAAKQVQGEVNKRMASALERIHAVSGIKSETGGYSVYQEQEKNAPSRWHASQALTIIGADFSQILALAGDLQNDGLISAGFDFELAPETARGAQEELTAEALHRLRQRADSVAVDLQMNVERYRDIRISNIDGRSPGIPFQMRSMSEASAPTSIAPPVAQAGEASVAVSVEADIVLLPADPHAP